MDCRKDESLRQLVNKCEQIQISRQTLLEKLDNWREVDFLERGEKRTYNLLHQLREEQDCSWLFIAQAYRGMEGRQDEIWYRRALHAPQIIDIKIKGYWKVEKYDTLTGKVESLDSLCRDGQTIVQYELYGNDSLMLRLKPITDVERKAECLHAEKRTQIGDQQGSEQRQTLPEPVGYWMSEPNALLLDRFEYALDQEEYQDACEMLKLDNRLRERLQLPLRCEALAQPYIRIKEEVRDHKLHLRTSFYSTTEISGCHLALEEAEHCICTLNGQKVNMEPQGYYVDPAITVVTLPNIRKGDNTLCVTMDYGDCTNLEWMYILGEFGVELRGAHAYLYQKPERLFWGDYTRQGFPFYTGNMTYVVKLPEGNQEDNGKDKILQVPYYSGAAVKVSSDNGTEQMLAFLPYKCKLNDLKTHDNVLQITCLGNRFNGFGQLHLIGDDLYWLGQNSWRTEGTSWTDTYQVKPMGILTAPQIILSVKVEE